MSDPNKKGPKDEETTVLHLNKFTSDQSTAASEEGATIFIKKAAEETVKAGSRVIVPSAAGSLAAEEMLGAVAYCYAKGVYSAEDIERKMLKDPEFREALGGVVPDPQSIRRFRKLNRAAIQEVLEKFYRRLRKQKPPTEVLPGAQPPQPAPPSTPAAATQVSSHPGESTAFFVKREATERLDKASFIDGMSQDN